MPEIGNTFFHHRIVEIGGMGEICRALDNVEWDGVLANCGASAKLA